jgi:hypothetical protein
MPKIRKGYRIEFSASTKRLVAERAGHECSFPMCNRRTVGSEARAGLVSRSGKASHIFSAAEKGPRGRGGLTEKELRSPENCIWFCSEHAQIVDNNRGVAYPPEELLAYKALQEARISRERQGLFIPVGWLFEIVVRESPIFQNGQKIRLAKLNLILGDNGTGKTAIAEWIAGFFQSGGLGRWHHWGLPVDVEMTFLNPSSHLLRLQIEGESLLYQVDEKEVPFIGMPLTIIRIGRLNFEENEGDDVALSRILSLPPQIVQNLFQEIERFPHSRMRKLHYKRDHETGRLNLHLDLDGTVPGLPLRSLSTREIDRVFIELATAAARVSGQYAPTLLILDGCPRIVFEGFFDFYSRHVLDADNHFQTVLCIPSTDIDLENLRWNGWELIQTVGKKPNVTITQQAT